LLLDGIVDADQNNASRHRPQLEADPLIEEARATTMGEEGFEPPQA
jgi:hypothetical protein